MKEKLNRFFKISERGSTIKTEIVAGLTTFFAMASIIVTNPNQVVGFNGEILKKEERIVTVKKLPVKMLGIDLKKDVITFCNNLARALGFSGLSFIWGDVADYTTTENPHLVISLHACDTATDYALAFAIKNNARGILSGPCCQHELNQTITKKAINPTLLPFLEHGIIKEHFCALATDTLRGKILEDCGYSIQLLEFIDVGHTPKNILIRGIKKREKTNITKE